MTTALVWGRGVFDAERDREVVQRREGIWVHYAGRRRQGRVRPSHRDPVGGISQPGRGPEGRIRRAGGSERTAGGERSQGRLSSRIAHAEAARARAGGGEPQVSVFASVRGGAAGGLASSVPLSVRATGDAPRVW